MFPSLPLGPLSLPTAQILALVAAWFGLSFMAQVGRRLHLDADMVWNLGTIGLAAGVIVARLAHAVQFWEVYRAEPLLLVSLRPGGLLLWPGVIGAVVAGYIYLIREGANPKPVAVAAIFGLLAGGAVLEISNFLTGAVVGTVSEPGDALWQGLALFGGASDMAASGGNVIRHPVALYRAIGMMAAVGGFLLWGNWNRPFRLAGQAVLAYALLRLGADGFAADMRLLGSVRITQVAALFLALGAAVVLAARAADNPHGQPQGEQDGTGSAPQGSV